MGVLTMTEVCSCHSFEQRILDVLFSALPYLDVAKVQCDRKKVCDDIESQSLSQDLEKLAPVRQVGINATLKRILF